MRDWSEESPQGTASAFEQLLEFAPDAIVGVDGGGLIMLANRQTEALFGYPREELLGAPLETLVPEGSREPHTRHRKAYFADPRMRPMGAGISLYGRRRDGTEFPAEISLSSIDTEDGLIGIAAVRDISERAESERERLLQEELHQARRLESVGQLAGGVAHDFNNLLGVIINYASFVAEELSPESQTHADVEEIRRAAERGAALTRQLLIFSRREVVKLEVLDLNVLVAGLENLLRRALGERVALQIELAPEPVLVKADRGQLEQVLVNLAVNGRDAMPDGGHLVIETGNALLDDAYTGMHPGLDPGEYVRLSVTDSGIGMEADVREQAFDPFFTTKAKGEGTGLGLATVYGIVTNAGGRVDLYSEPGFGTTVKMLLPVSQGWTRPHREHALAAPGGNGETVLLVEDEPDVRRMTERLLSRTGYTVMSASGAAEAKEVAERYTVDIVLTDVVMPGMLGTELVDLLRETRSGLRVIFMSGYSHRMLSHEALANDTHSLFVEKPFNRAELLSALRTVLDVPEEQEDA